jgi:hypothetical protein
MTFESNRTLTALIGLKFELRFLVNEKHIVLYVSKEAIDYVENS